MSVALQRSISGECNAHKHGCSGALFSVPAIFHRTTVIISGRYVIRFVAEILINARTIFYGEKDFAQRWADASREL
jgi:hypothetical protein